MGLCFVTLIKIMNNYNNEIIDDIKDIGKGLIVAGMVGFAFDKKIPSVIITTLGVIFISGGWIYE